MARYRATSCRVESLWRIESGISDTYYCRPRTDLTGASSRIFEARQRKLFFASSAGKMFLVSFSSFLDPISTLTSLSPWAPDILFSAPILDVYESFYALMSEVKRVRERREGGSRNPRCASSSKLQTASTLNDVLVNLPLTLRRVEQFLLRKRAQIKEEKFFHQFMLSSQGYQCGNGNFQAEKRYWNGWRRWKRGRKTFEELFEWRSRSRFSWMSFVG